MMLIPQIILLFLSLGVSAMEKNATYGSWQSPITAEQVAKGTLRFSEVKIDDGKIYWLEQRPSDSGRTTIMSWSASEGEQELLAREYNVSSKVHEYGGGALLVNKGRIYFVNKSDQQIYNLLAGGKIEKITSRNTARFADGCIHPKAAALFYVMEEHNEQVTNTIVRIDLLTGKIATIASGQDFYASPRISPDGKKLAYVCWSHPNMPWDGTELWVLDLQTNQRKKVAGGISESIVDPKWSMDGELYYISDRSNWWNIFKGTKPLWQHDAEFALPHWIFGRSLMGFAKDGIFCSYVKNGTHSFAKISFDGKATPVNLPFTNVQYVSVEGEKAALIASSLSQPSSIVLYDLKKGTAQTIKRCCSSLIAHDYISQPIAVEYPSNGRTAHAFYYPPLNPNYRGLPNEKPPILVNLHGGPTAHVSPTYSPTILFWTSRGFAYLDVNYGGSTSYGRKYRDSLKGKWGIIDVDDCTNGALYCVKQGLADPSRLTVSGGSAGGFTTLASLAFRDVFKAGADFFGVSDLERLALDTHKFEARYLDGLVGPYPEQRDTYLKRSPIYHIEKITQPIIIFQGDKDTVVPPSQSEMMFKTLVASHIPTAYLLFKGEGHGFEKAENIQRSLEAQLYFFSKILKFPLSEKIEAVPIENLLEIGLVTKN